MDLENPTSPTDYPWGGDGSDLHEPVRAHVEAALVPTDGVYPPPVDQLLRLGEPDSPLAAESVIAGLDFTPTHIPDLVRMARDRALNTADMDSDEVWAPVYALTALERLGPHPAWRDLVPLLDVRDDWLETQLPTMLGQAGDTVVDAVIAYVQDSSRWLYGRALAAEALGRIAQQNSALRPQAVEALTRGLEGAADQAPDLNAFLIAPLLDLQAVEALPAIRRAYELDAVEEMVVGDWLEILEALDQEPDPNDPLVQAALPPPPGPRGSQPRSGSTAKKKRKQADKSRKANRAKKKKR